MLQSSSSILPQCSIKRDDDFTHFPEVAVDGDAWLPELDVLMDVGGVSATPLNHKSDQSVNIDLSVASLSGHPVGWVLATDQSLEDGSLGLEVLADARNVTGPGSLSTTNMM